MAAREGGYLPLPGLSATPGHEVSHPHQVVATGDELEDPADLGPAPVAKLMEEPHRLHPAEGFLG